MYSNLSNQQLLQLAQNFGTPLYVYNANKITEQYDNLTTAFKGQSVRFFYASKALTNISILNHVRSIGCHVDCSSINEVHMALHAGFLPNQILYTSNGIAFSEIEEAKNIGVFINIDSLSNLQKFGEKFGNSYPIGIRLRPNIMAGGNLKISTGHDKSKFGIPVQQLPEILSIVQQYNMHISGLHIHTGSEIKDVAIFVKGIEVLFEIIPHFKQLTYIDLGGGFKVAYKENDAVTDIPLLAKKVGEAFAHHPYHQPLEVWFEPGKYMVSECGSFLTTVNVLKETGNITFAGVDSGFNHLIRPMFYDAYHHITNISNPLGEEKVYNVVGNICETDTFAWDRKLAAISEGDILHFANAGAYGFEMSSNFNSRFKPAEVMVKDEDIFLIRKRDTLEDLLSKQVLIS
jgi:diaminopimelate decarboxylase